MAAGSPDELLGLLRSVAAAIRARLDGQADWGESGRREGQYEHDVAADEVAVSMLVDAGLGVVSEESGDHSTDRRLVAVVDPVDGSTNASLRVPWWATSIAVVDGDGLVAGLVVNQVTGTTWEATRGGGAHRDGRLLPRRRGGPGGTDLAMVTTNGWPPARPPSTQFRILGASALDLCGVADGSFDGFVDWSGEGLAPWDYYAALLICSETGAAVADADGRDLLVAGHRDRRAPVAGGTAAQLDRLLAARAGAPPAG